MNAQNHTTRVFARCGECGRVFDLTNEVDTDEWTHGHDCEDQSTTSAQEEITE